MVKITSVMAVALAMLAIGCDDGPVKRRINCIEICNKVEDCVGDSNFSKAECKDQCNDEDADAVDQCDECLSDQDSCIEKTACTAECGGVVEISSFR